MYIADIDGRKYERQRQEAKRELVFIASCCGIAIGLVIAAIVYVAWRPM